MLGEVSHETRSPLARLNVALALAGKTAGNEARAHLGRIECEAESLDALIGQLLTIARIESGVDALKRETFDLTELGREACGDADFEARAHHRRVSLNDGGSCPVSGFPELLRSAMENVLRNAIRFTANETAVEVVLRRVDDHASLTIRDHGPGMTDTHLGEIFKPFWRGDPTSAGSGLGLAIAERVVHAHEGTIRATCAIGLLTCRRTAARSMRPDHWLLRLRDFLSAQCCDPLTMATLTSVTGRHPVHLTRVRPPFRKDDQRIRAPAAPLRAAQLLREDSLPLAAIATECGF